MTPFRYLDYRLINPGGHRRVMLGVLYSHNQQIFPQQEIEQRIRHAIALFNYAVRDGGCAFDLDAYAHFALSKAHDTLRRLNIDVATQRAKIREILRHVADSPKLKLALQRAGISHALWANDEHLARDLAQRFKLEKSLMTR